MTKWLTLLVAFCLLPGVGKSDESLVSQMEKAISKGLPFVAKKGDSWIESKKCMSCHRVAFTAWSHVEAKKAGISVDESQVNEWIDWCNENLFEPFPEKDQKFPGEQTIERNLSGAAQVLALAKNWESTNDQKEHQLKIIQKLKKGQQKNGGWNPKGQLPGQKRKLAETAQVITLWNSVALINIAEQEHVDAGEIDPLIESAKKFVNPYGDGESTEWLALRSLFATRTGDDKTGAKFLEKTFSVQNSDGGWGWIAGEESDVLATAQVIYALSEMKHDLNSAAVQKAVRYLIESQTEQGNWQVKGTKEKAKRRFTETANYWGSAWAIIALSRVKAAVQQTAETN